VSDELAEAERFLRSEMSELSKPVSGETDTRDIWLVMTEYDRRGRIEKAATEVVKHWRGLDDAQLIRIERAAKVELPDLLDDLVTAVDRPWQGAAAHPWRQCEPPIEINLKSSGTWRCPCGKKWVLSVNASGPTPYFVWTEMGQVSEDD